VLRFVEGAYVLFQRGEGQMGFPELGAATIDQKSNDIGFKIPGPDNSEVNFTGKMTAKLLTGTFDNHWTPQLTPNNKTFNLPRIDSGQGGLGNCR
jgi:hypothetical protein